MFVQIHKIVQVIRIYTQPKKRTFLIIIVFVFIKGYFSKEWQETFLGNGGYLFKSYVSVINEM